MILELVSLCPVSHFLEPFASRPEGQGEGVIKVTEAYFAEVKRGGRRVRHMAPGYFHVRKDVHQPWPLAASV